MWTFDDTAVSATAAPRAGRINLIAGLASLAAAAVLASSAASAQSKEAGIWYDDTGKGAVQVFPCDGKLCGRIVWLKEPLGDDGKPLYDGYNPNPNMRARPICGLQVLGGLTRQADGSWDEGWVYDPKVGKSYNAAIEVSGKYLTLTGYLGVRLLGQSFTWTKAPASLPNCMTSKAAAN